jgi:hypothetical protein
MLQRTQQLSVAEETISACCGNHSTHEGKDNEEQTWERRSGGLVAATTTGLQHNPSHGVGAVRLQKRYT